jgi:zinc protease
MSNLFQKNSRTGCELITVVVITLIFTTAVYAGPDIKHWQTSRGVRVYFVESHELPMVDLQIVFDAGSVRDPEEKLGLAQLANSLLNQEAGGMNADDISFEFERLGAEYSARGAYDTASVSLRSLSDQGLLNSAIDILKKVVTNPKFSEEVIERERNRLLVGIQRKYQSPQAIAAERFDEEVFSGHPYAHPNEGTPESLKNITRNDLVRFHADYFVAQTAMITLVGDISLDQAESISETVTSHLPMGNAPVYFPQVQPQVQGKVIKVNHPSTQVHILVGQPGMKYGDPDYFPLYVGNHILGGGGLVSRLFEEVREKRGLSYGASSYFSPRRGLGEFQASISTREDQTDEALQVLTQTIRDFIENGPSETELVSSKKNITGGFPLRIDSNGNISGYLSVIGFYGLPLDYLETFNDKVEAVTVEDIKDAFRRRLDADNFVTVLVGPFSEEE